MKKIFFGILAMAAFAACSNEEQIAAPQGEAIAFGNAFVDNSVRADAATDPSYSTSGKGVALEKFNVYGAVNGVNIFNGNNVTKTAGYGAAWDCDGPKQYWITGAPYKFVAVVDGNKTGVTTITPDAAGLPETIAYTVDGATDLLCDVQNIASAVAGQGVVAFTFDHLLSKVKFTVKNTTEAAATNYQIVFTKAQITDTYANGEYDVNTDAWTSVSGTLNYNLENLTIASGATQYNSKEVLLLPGTNKVGVDIEAEIQASSDGGTTWTTVSTLKKDIDEVIALERGKAYNFIVELGVGTEIQFTATTMTEWGNGNTVDTSDPADGVNDIVPVN